MRRRPHEAMLSERAPESRRITGAGRVAAIRGRPKIIVLGMITQHIVAGHVWAVLHYLIGLRRLGYDVYYVEAHSCSPSSFFRQDNEDGWLYAADFVDRTMDRFGFGDRWAYHDVLNGRYYGLGRWALERLYGSAALLINMHGGTVPLPEHIETGRLVYIDTDPGELQINLHAGDPFTTDLLSAHCALFTYAENYGQPDCRLPVSDRFRFRKMRAPVLMDVWEPYRTAPGRRFTTVGSWKQSHRVFEFEGETYHWSKHLEFMKFFDLPRRTSQEFELALGKIKSPERGVIKRQGWKVRRARLFCYDLDEYRCYIAGSRGEFTASKGQYALLRTGWFSNRSNTYLATGLPVITQETGFSNVLPTGAGLFGFSTMDEILAAVDAINSDYDRHCSAAADLAREYFRHDVVLRRFLSELGV